MSAIAEKEDWLLRVAADAELPAGALRVAIAVGRHMNCTKGLSAWPGFGRLQKLLGVGRRTVIRGVQALERQGHLRVARDCRDGKRNAPNHYFPNLAQGGSANGDTSAKDDTRVVPTVALGGSAKGGTLTYNIEPITELSCSPSGERESKEVGRRKQDWPRDYFERFWEAYPRKTGKLAARRKLDVVRRADEVSFARLLSAVGKINVSDPKFIPYPATWLNQGRYLDDEAAPQDVPRGEFVPSPDMPTEEELRKRYAKRREIEATSAESARVLDRGPGFCDQHEQRVGVDKARNGGMRSLGEIFPMERLGAVRHSPSPVGDDQRNGDAGEIS